MGSEHTSDDAQLADQPFAEQFTVWAIRSWVAGLKEGAARSFALQRGFDLAGIPEGAGTLDGLLSTVARGAVRSIDIRCVRCRWLSDDERALLAAIGGCQAGAKAAAHVVLGDFVVPAATRVAAEYAATLAADLARADLLLRREEPGFTASVHALHPESGATLH